MRYLHSRGARNIAITDGPQPIRFRSSSSTGHVSVPEVTVVDTTGAGDVFHGAFCRYIVEAETTFERALEAAAIVAARSCETFATRAWIERLRSDVSS